MNLTKKKFLSVSFCLHRTDRLSRFWCARLLAHLAGRFSRWWAHHSPDHSCYFRMGANLNHFPNWATGEKQGSCLSCCYLSLLIGFERRLDQFVENELTAFFSSFCRMSSLKKLTLDVELLLLLLDVAMLNFSVCTDVNVT